MVRVDAVTSIDSGQKRQSATSRPLVTQKKTAGWCSVEVFVRNTFHCYPNLAELLHDTLGEGLAARPWLATNYDDDNATGHDDRGARRLRGGGLGLSFCSQNMLASFGCWHRCCRRRPACRFCSAFADADSSITWIELPSTESCTRLLPLGMLFAL